MEEQTEPVKTLKDHAREAIDHYFDRLKGERIDNLYDLVWDEVEEVLIEETMKHTKHNQSKAAYSCLTRSLIPATLDHLLLLHPITNS